MKFDLVSTSGVLSKMRLLSCYFLVLKFTYIRESEFY